MITNPLKIISDFVSSDTHSECTEKKTKIRWHTIFFQTYDFELMETIKQVLIWSGERMLCKLRTFCVDVWPLTERRFQQRAWISNDERQKKKLRLNKCQFGAYGEHDVQRQSWRTNVTDAFLNVFGLVIAFYGSF